MEISSCNLSEIFLSFNLVAVITIGINQIRATEIHAAFKKFFDLQATMEFFVKNTGYKTHLMKAGEFTELNGSKQRVY